MLKNVERAAKKLLSKEWFLGSDRGSKFILCYHHLSERIGGLDSALYTTTTERFREHLELLKGRFDLVTLDELLRPGPGLASDRNQMSITFDDGFMSVFTIARPILQAMSIPYTVFVNGCAIEHGQSWVSNVAGLRPSDGPYVTHFLNSVGVDPGSVDLTDHDGVIGAIMSKGKFTEKAIAASLMEAPPAGLYMGRTEIQQLHDEGVLIGDHGFHHFVLGNCEGNVLSDMLHRGRDLITELTGSIPLHFAIPFGKKEHYTRPTVELIAEAGYDHVHTTNPNRVRRSDLLDDPRLVPRIGIVDNTISELIFYLNRTALRRYDI